MAAVMFAGDDALAGDGERLGELIEDPQLAAELAGEGAGEAAPGAGDVAQEVDQDALEFDEGLLVEGDAVDVAGGEAGVREAGEGGGDREAGVVLDPREALLLDRGDQLAVDDERGGGVVVVGGDAEDAGHRGHSREAGSRPRRIGRAMRTSRARGAARM